MKKVREIASQFATEEHGAAMIEYTVLLGLVSAVAIGVVVTVGLWVGGQWDALSTGIAGEGAAPRT